MVVFKFELINSFLFWIDNSPPCRDLNPGPPSMKQIAYQCATVLRFPFESRNFILLYQKNYRWRILKFVFDIFCFAARGKRFERQKISTQRFGQFIKPLLHCSPTHIDPKQSHLWSKGKYLYVKNLLFWYECSKKNLM